MLFIAQRKKILPVSALAHRMCQCLELVGIDITQPICDLFGAGNHQSLTALDGLNVKSSLKEGIVRPGIEPRHATAHHLHLQFAGFAMRSVQGGNLEFAARRGPERSCKIYYVVVVEIEAGDRVTGFRCSRFFFDANGVAGFVELHDSIALWVVHGISKDKSSTFQSCGAL